jgi:general secretion pathway protein M
VIKLDREKSLAVRACAVIKLDREQMLSIGALAALLLVCLGLTGLSLQMRAGAAQELAEHHDLLSRLEARAKARREARAQSGAAAPAAAFLDAPTHGLAVAQLQAHLVQMADIHHAVLVSSGIEPTRREDPPDSIRLQATLEMSLQAVQAFLYQLESGTPYVFVDQLALQLAGTASQRAVEEPLLRVTLGLRAIWRRGTA